MKTLKFWNRGKKDNQQGGGEQESVGLTTDEKKSRALDILRQVAQECPCEPFACGCADKARNLAKTFFETETV